MEIETQEQKDRMKEEAKQARVENKAKLSKSKIMKQT